MKTSTIITFMTLSLVNAGFLPGALFITTLNNESAHKRLSVKEDALVQAKTGTVFDYDLRDGLKVLGARKYLMVNQLGKVVVGDTIRDGFGLTDPRDWRVIRNVTYYGSGDFELCSDNLIGYRSKCEGAQKIGISYEDLINPR